MSQRFGRAAAGVALTALVALVTMTLAPGCSPAQAQPIDVTYYYLPG